MALIYNPTPGPVTIDDAGAVLGGGERIEAPITDAIRAHLDAGRLITQTAPSATPKPTGRGTEGKES